MDLSGRRKSVAGSIALAVGLISVLIVLYIGYVLLNWRTGILLVMGVLLVLMIIGGVILNTIFLVSEIRRNEQHDAFINAVTHELKTPVASIRLYLETLQSRPVDEARRQEFYRIMLEDSDRLLGSIEQILRTGRFGSAGRKPNISRVEIGAVVEECVERARILYHLPSDALTWSAGSPATVLADPEEVRAAVSNLVDNAVKYSGREVKVTVALDTSDSRYATVRVQDHGPGIPKVHLKDVFKRFHRIPGTAALRIPGTGLGLFIVRAVAKRHGGRAWAESEGVGHGSTFVFQLPIAP